MRTALAFSLLALAAAVPAAAQSPAPAQPPRIVVAGEGEAAVAPDMAILTLSVMREAATAREALDASNEAMAAVIAAMKEAGIAPRDLQTAGLQINPRYVYPQPGQPPAEPRIDGYQVVNMLNVRVRDLAIVGDVLDRSVTLGVNQGGAIAFTNDDPAATLAEARRLAVADALERAKVLADAAGVGLGPVMEITEQSAPPMPMPYAMKASRDMAESVPVEAGENAYRVTVTVTFGLEPKK